MPPKEKATKPLYPPTLKRLGKKNPIAVGLPVHQLKDHETLRQHGSVEFSIRTIDMPSAVKQLKLKGKDASWIVFMFNTPIVSADTDDQTLNLQYSIDGGVLGFDWVLLGPRNIADKSKLIRYIKARKHKVEQRNMNGVSYLRVENGDVAKLGKSIAEDFYQITADIDVGLLVCGFELSGGYRWTV